MSLSAAKAAHFPAPAQSAREPGRALLWLVLCGSLFYLGYGFANWAAAQQGTAASIRFGWERGIPFLPWTIIPYWSIDLFYALAFFLCIDALELQRHVRRILTAQLVAVVCFLVFPLQLAVAKPATDGLFGLLFAALGTFDRPYNQAPSLHIALLVILWDLYARHLLKRFHIALHAWALLIGISVLTTWQHHFIDVPTGAALGLLCLWLWPAQGALRFQLTHDAKRWRIAAFYALGAAFLGCAALQLGGWQLWLLWPALSLGLVALNYLGFGAAGFQKREDGRIPIATRLLLALYLLGARMNAWLWTAADRPNEVADGVWIGALPRWFAEGAPAFATVIDLCAELPAAPHAGRHIALPALDLIPLTTGALGDAVAAIEAARPQGPVLVACALGYGRSAAAVAAWLVATGRAASPEAAVDALRARRPRVALHARQLS
ncbi:phosphatase PAP2/dual specificity phosphatase family protein [Dongia sp.]|uniref:phosphatase PAP2/dual specificity phosphatase family protein n=1 Tax=Dongia sp. TaxID=1977262 RepID=UPI003753256B